MSAGAASSSSDASTEISKSVLPTDPPDTLGVATHSTYANTMPSSSEKGSATAGLSDSKYETDARTECTADVPCIQDLHHYDPDAEQRTRKQERHKLSKVLGGAWFPMGQG